MQNIGIRIVPSLIASSLKEKLINKIKESISIGAFWDNAIKGWHPALYVSGDMISIPYNYMVTQIDIKNLPYSLKRRVEMLQERKLLLLNKIFEDSWCSYTRDNSNNLEWWSNRFLAINELETILEHTNPFAHKE